LSAPGFRPDPRFLEAFAEILRRIGASLKNHAGMAVPVYIAGGAATHLYTGARFSKDIDARIGLDRYIPPGNLEVSYVDPEGLPRTLYFDTSYNESFALLHENVHEDSIRVHVEGVDPRVLDVRVFSPVDLAVSKLSRFETHDQEDIEALARAGLIDSKSVRRRAEEALPGHVGGVDRIKGSIALACKLIDRARGDAGQARKPRKARPP
jgi:hypothetical protein